MLNTGCSFLQLFLSSIDFKLEIQVKKQGDQRVHIFFRVWWKQVKYDIHLQKSVKIIVKNIDYIFVRRKAYNGK